ncbi:MAG: hypothetical protein SGJ27_10955 [Candidatus Melainabacteria bacterium]|nr:hypothetical protein [Candidatus Melainabacteria bacterium]
MAKCTFVTYSDLPDLDPDDRLVFDILKNRGIDCQSAIWDDPNVDWSKAGVTVLRTTWDYHKKYQQFLDWVDRVSKVTTLCNRPEYIRWNACKIYLRDLSEAGIAIVPTDWIMRDEKVDVKKRLIEILKENNGKVVLKPSVGLATSGVLVVDRDNFDAGVDHAKKLLKEYDLMVQPFMSSVETKGEKALVFINGRFCHAAQKAAFQTLAVAGQAGEKPIDVTMDEVELAENTMSIVSEIVRKHENRSTGIEDDTFLPPPLYARVDIVRDQTNRPVVIELELVEPSLFMDFYPLDADLFADSIEFIIKRMERLAQARVIEVEIPVENKTDS